MLVKVIRFFVTAIMAVIGGVIMHFANPVLTTLLSTQVLQMEMGIYKLTLANVVFVTLGVAIGAGIGYVFAPFFADKLQRFSVWVEGQLNKMPLHDVIAGVIGLAIGLIIANLLGATFSNIPVVGDYVPVLFSIVFGYLGIHIVIRKQKEIQEMFGRIPRLIRLSAAKERGAVKDNAAGIAGEPIDQTAAVLENVQGYNSLVACKLLDTSVIIDGRIADICRSGFIDGKLLIPVFVLEELQHIADSADTLKRVRGRRGLDILQQLRTECASQIEIVNTDFTDITEVDSKLVRLGQMTGGKIITNDYNLNKVAELQGVAVLNINDLANSVKPVVIPGEYMQVSVVKEGKEYGQGVAYLDDGTMIVIENGRQYINENIKVEVTSALQTSAGRLIFAKPVV